MCGNDGTSCQGLELVDKMRKVIGEGEQVYGFDFAAGDTAGRNIPVRRKIQPLAIDAGLINANEN